MTPAQNTIAATTTIDGGLEWSSPIPYLFGGMFIAFSLIACALIILACSYKKVYSNNTSGGDEEKPYSLPNNTQLASEIVINRQSISTIVRNVENVKATRVHVEANTGPNTVVIMTGI
ncbi:hypothetical protein Ccrd_019094 [Cynara cardunculus var. scolymus]|uniref:Uncharacterized protein n=1 Tax=Cynara cardunculus var. scolymus TaxID=59895 RepID=A0A103Y4Z1_CYNCS|nr:hypothetical protein Ccrd_019094 [Cynara cardunculus var. scolymus]